MPGPKWEDTKLYKAGPGQKAQRERQLATIRAEAVRAEQAATDADTADVYQASMSAKGQALRWALRVLENEDA